MMNFPDTPTSGQSYGTYTWDGEKWVSTGSLGGVPEAPADHKIYGRKDLTWQEVISDVTKAYVDAQVAARVAKAGDVMTGALTLTALTSTAGINLGANAVAVATDVTRHIALYGSSYGLSVTGSTLNIVSSGAAIAQFHASDVRFNGTVLAAVSTFGPSNVDGAGIISSGPWGGGLTSQDGGSRSAMWCQAGDMALASGTTVAPPIRLILANNGNHTLYGTARITGGLNVGSTNQPTRAISIDAGNAYLGFSNGAGAENWLIGKEGDPGSLCFFRPGTGYTFRHDQNGTTFSTPLTCNALNTQGSGITCGPLSASGPINTANSAGGMGFSGPSNALMVLSDAGSGGAAYMTFHRQGSYAAHIGIDNDNQFKVGGWSMGGPYKIWHEANFAPGSYVAKGGDTMSGSLTVNGNIATNSLSCSHLSSYDIYTNGYGITCWGITSYGGGTMQGSLWVHNGGDYGLLYFGNGGGRYIESPGNAFNFQGGNISCSGNISSAGEINAGTYSNMHCWVMYNQAMSTGDWISCGGDATVTGTVVGGGYKCRPGYQQGLDGNTFNIHWDGDAHLYIDYTYIINLSSRSDYRTKKDVVALPSMWEAVKALRPIKYSHTDFTLPSGFKSSGSDIERWGFIAHELQETLTLSAATGVKDSPDTIQSLNTFTVVAALTKALQEAMTRIEKLETKH